MFFIYCCYLISFIYLRVGIYLHLVNACLIKCDQLKMLIAVQPCQLFLDYSLACHIIYETLHVNQLEYLQWKIKHDTTRHCGTDIDLCWPGTDPTPQTNHRKGHRARIQAEQSPQGDYLKTKVTLQDRVF
jgi:hypothetical protein